jgi:hypothetical protein
MGEAMKDNGRMELNVTMKEIAVQHCGEILKDSCPDLKPIETLTYSGHESS